MQILAINPGSTSTKIAVYDDEKPILLRTIRHWQRNSASLKTSSTNSRSANSSSSTN